MGASRPLYETHARSAYAKYAVASVTILGGYPGECDEFGWWRSHLPAKSGYAGEHVEYWQTVVL